jgi:hypothetical protein
VALKVLGERLGQGGLGQGSRARRLRAAVRDLVLLWLARQRSLRARMSRSRSSWDLASFV